MIHLERTRPEQSGEIVRFLIDVFKISPTAPVLEQRLIQWKYFTPHPFWEGSRSYVLCRDKTWAAHGCVTPFLYETSAGLSCIQIIDWASSKSVPGAGGVLIRDMMKLQDAFMTVGGSEAAKRIIPLFKELTVQPPLRVYAKPVSPWRRPVTWTARGLAKTARAYVRSYPVSAAPKGWKAERSAEVVDHPCLHMPTGLGVTPLRRSAELIQYLLTCPAAGMEFYWLTRGAERAGFFLLSRLKGQTRIADLVVASSGRLEWIAGYRTAMAEAAKGPGVTEIAAGSSATFLQSVMEACGFLNRDEYTVAFADRNGTLTNEPPVEVNLSIGDAFYLQDPNNPLWM